MVESRADQIDRVGWQIRDGRCGEAPNVVSQLVLDFRSPHGSMRIAVEKVEVTGHWEKIGAQDLGFEAEAQK
jgi:hypothetical protein